jgi:hypothetical protein
MDAKTVDNLRITLCAEDDPPATEGCENAAQADSHNTCDGKSGEDGESGDEDKAVACDHHEWRDPNLER